MYCDSNTYIVKQIMPSGGWWYKIRVLANPEEVYTYPLMAFALVEVMYEDGESENVVMGVDLTSDNLFGLVELHDESVCVEYLPPPELA